jgi:outer membrane protein assembly factor BamE (lipoprotein component of BamABCDE complex)
MMRTMEIPGRLAPVRMAVAAMATLVVVALTGCVVIPVDYNDINTRRNITPDTASSLVPGVTTREEIILRLGEPNHVADEGRRIGYAWEKVKALMAAGYGYGGAAGEIERGYLLEITFDRRNKVREVNVRKKWGPVLGEEGAGMPWEPIKEPVKVGKYAQRPGAGSSLVRVMVRDRHPPVTRRDLFQDGESPFQETRIHFTPSEADLVRNMLETELTRALAARGVSRPRSLSCDLTKFKVRTKSANFYYDVVIDIHLTLHHGSKRYPVTGSFTKRGISLYSGLIVPAVEGSFADMDDDLARVARALAP